MKFWIIELYLDVSDVIHANEHTKHVYCDLHVNFWSSLLMLLSFMMKKDHFNQKLLVWPHIPFKKIKILTQMADWVI